MLSGQRFSLASNTGNGLNVKPSSRGCVLMVAMCATHTQTRSNVASICEATMSDASGIETAKYLLTQYERELARTSEAYAAHMPVAIASEYLRRRHYAEGCVDVLRKVMAAADGPMETLG